jgi:hypothetical protein
MVHRIPALLAIIFLIPAPRPAAAQQQRGIVEFPMPPRFAQEVQDLGAIAQVQMQGSSSSRSISMTIENGVRKITAADNDVKAWIEEHPEGDLIIKVTRHYTKADLNELMNDEPEIYMHLKSIPDKTETAEIDVSVGVTRTYEAASAEELKENHPDVFDIYERFTIGGADDLSRMQQSPLFPRLQIDPVPPIQLNVGPGGIRIHPLPDNPRKQDKRPDRPAPDDKDT